MHDSRYQAVVFDFFGTLTHPVTMEVQREAVGPVARAMGVPVDRVISTLAASFSDRCRGRWGSFRECMARLAKEVGARLSEDDLAEVCRVRLTTQERHYLQVRSDAESVLRELKKAGSLVGLISDCTHELPLFWPGLPIAPLVDAATFSIEAGTKKPDPSLYLSTAKRLGVPADRCLYVGDGGGNELTGAARVGMTAVLLDDPVGRTAIVYDRDGWDGASIGALGDVPDLVARGS